jgi:hypothetical protein
LKEQELALQMEPENSLKSVVHRAKLFGRAMKNKITKYANGRCIGLGSYFKDVELLFVKFKVPEDLRAQLLQPPFDGEGEDSCCTDGSSPIDRFIGQSKRYYCVSLSCRVLEWGARGRVRGRLERGKREEEVQSEHKLKFTSDVSFETNDCFNEKFHRDTARHCARRGKSPELSACCQMPPIYMSNSPASTATVDKWQHRNFLTRASISSSLCVKRCNHFESPEFGTLQVSYSLLRLQPYSRSMACSV